MQRRDDLDAAAGVRDPPRAGAHRRDDEVDDGLHDSAGSAADVVTESAAERASVPAAPELLVTESVTE